MPPKRPKRLSKSIIGAGENATTRPNPAKRRIQPVLPAPRPSMLDFRRVFVHVQGARNLQLGGGGTVTVLVTTGTGKDCKAESEAVPAGRTPTWNLETTLALPSLPWS